MTFLTEPSPERITYLSFTDNNKVTPMLSVGLQIIEATPDGLKVEACPRVVVAMGDTAEPEKVVFDLAFTTARALANRIMEFCDKGEAMING